MWHMNFIPANEYLVLILGMGLVTYLPRWFPLFFLAKRNLPKVLVDWLDLIPAAILSALLVPALLTTARGISREMGFTHGFDPRHTSQPLPEYPSAHA